MTRKMKQEFSQLSEATKELYCTLCANVRGQNEAIHYFVQGVFKGQFMPDTYAQAINNIFLFSGPPKIGKAHLAYVAAEVLGREILEVNLDANAAETLAEDLANTVSGNAGTGRVTKFVAENPNGILLFKNIDKASPRVVSAISKIIETGGIVNPSGKLEISFVDTIMIFTTNVGTDIYFSEEYCAVQQKSIVLPVFAEELAESEFPMIFFYEYFKDDHIIFFRELKANHIVELIDQSFFDFAVEIQKQYGYELKLDPEMINLCLYHQCNIIDASTVLSLSRDFLKNEFYELSRHLEDKKLKRLKKVIFTVEEQSEDSPFYSLFSFPEKPKAMVVADKGKYNTLMENEYIDYFLVQDIDEVVKTLSEENISFVLLDLLCGGDNQEMQGLSLEDESFDGRVIFDILRDNLPNLPVYIIQQEGISMADYSTFLQMGAFGSVDLETKGEEVLLQLLMIARDILIQKNFDVLQREGLVLNYNTSQKLSEDGLTAEITFYDFEFKKIKAPEPLDEYLEPVDEEIHFDDIVGSKKAKADLKYIGEYLTNPEVFVMKYHSVPGGVLLFGLADAGKALLGRALATETNACLLMINPSNLVNLTPEENCQLLRDLFERAIKEAPAVILMDKLDLVVNSGGLGAVNTIINGIKNIRECGSPVIFIGNLNWEHSTVTDENSNFDPELLHLLEYKIYVSLPDRDERIAGITKALKEKGIDTISDTLIQNIADRVLGHSIADINDFISLASRMALKQQKELNSDILSDALDELTYGQKREWDEIDYFSTAVHEAGHAYMLWRTGEESSFVTIVGREDYGGYT
ncbi:MAG: AAA family ATPase, partial [Anaerovibrio sp.]|uniref:ATP-binding protein n=1 Tax=Anaerovibrio sp. TaxID=1872532 RepID=UPI0025DB5779